MPKFKSLGRNVQISSKASFYGAERISIGDNVRIDDFVILSAGEEGMEIGNHVHIGCQSSVIGNGRIVFCDFSGIAAKVSVYSSSDDIVGHSLVNPTVPEQFRRVKSTTVTFGRHTSVGAGSVVLPGADLEEGAVVGALSVVKGRLEGWHIHGGNPAVKIMRRSRALLELESKLETNK